MNVAERLEDDEPTPDQYGLTKQRVADIEKRIESNDLTVTVIVSIVFLVVSFFVVDSLLVRLPGLMFFFFVLAGFGVGTAVHSCRSEQNQKSPDYSRYANYRHATDEHQKRQRRIRWKEASKRRTPYEERKAIRDKWYGIDGRVFEIEVARILVNKGYVVNHVGSNSADGGA